jgi:prepilin-type N-terminal cleavage/methylation domain-containing protein
MSYKPRNSKEEGFTIIEVLIVLAIAGLILLIVFLAVPALQRNSRNTQRKDDVAKILAAVSEFSNNNNGRLPNGTWTNANGTLTIIGLATDTNSESQVGYYNNGVAAANGGVVRSAAGTVTVANTLNSNTEDYVIVATGTECNGNASQAGPVRSVTAVFEIENGRNAYAQQCQSV